MQKDIIKVRYKSQNQLTNFKKITNSKGKKMKDENMFLHPNLMPFLF